MKWIIICFVLLHLKYAETSTSTSSTTTTTTSTTPLPTTHTTTSTSTTESPADAPNQPTPTPPTPSPTPPPHKCSTCEHDDFMGFGFMAGKCGCCPWPCCCKCIKKEGKQGPCRELLDLAFIIDASGSIGTIDWDRVKSFLNHVVSGLTSVGTDQHVAAITYSTDANLQWNLDSDKTSSLSNLQTAISKLMNLGQFTNTADAIEMATKRIFKEPQDNPKAANVAVIMTDGKANFRTGEIKDLSEKLRDKATTICIGVTDKVNDKELEDICEDRIYKVSQFEELAGIVQDLQTEICPTPPVSEKCYCCCTPEMYFGDQASNRYYW